MLHLKLNVFVDVSALHVDAFLKNIYSLNYLKKVMYLSYLCMFISVCHQRLFISPST